MFASVNRLCPKDSAEEIAEDKHILSEKTEMKLTLKESTFRDNYRLQELHGKIFSLDGRQIG